MDKSRRKELTQAFKERPREAGVVAVRCSASGEAWVGGSRNLDTEANKLWFTLDLGGHPNKALQAAFKAHGRSALTCEPVERFDIADLSDYEIKTRLTDLERNWREALSAQKLVG
jgi:hypothetical protein